MRWLEKAAVKTKQLIKRTPRPTLNATPRGSADVSRQPPPGAQHDQQGAAPTPQGPDPTVPEAPSGSSQQGAPSPAPPPATEHGYDSRSESAQAHTESDPHSHRSGIKQKVVDGVLKALRLTKELSDALPPLKMAATVLIEIVETYQVRAPDSATLRHSDSRAISMLYRYI